jgi:hypothetical protein
LKKVIIVGSNHERQAALYKQGQTKSGEKQNVVATQPQHQTKKEIV